MNFQFTVTAHGFDKAGKIEAALKEMSIPFEIKHMNGPTSRGTGKRKAKGIVDALVITAVLHSHEDNPNWSHSRIAKQHNLGDTVVGRILKKLHPLQIRGM